MISRCLLLLAALGFLLPSSAPAQEDGRELFRKLMVASGRTGEFAILGYRTRGTLRVTGKQNAVFQRYEVVVPGLGRHWEIEDKDGTIAYVVTQSGQAFAARGARVEDASPAVRAQWMASLKLLPDNLAAHIDDPAYQFNVVGAESVGGVPVKVLRIGTGAVLVEWYIGPDTVLRRTVVTCPDEKGGSGRYVCDVLDVRYVRGLRMAFRSQCRDGDDLSTFEVVSVQLNPPVDQRLFARPPRFLSDVPFTPDAASLQPPRRPATLVVRSAPGGAHLYLNDSPKGVTSVAEGRLVLTDLDPGEYRLRLSLLGHQDHVESVTLKLLGSVEVVAQLNPSGPPPFSVADVEQMLRGGVSLKRVAVLVKERGVDFAVDDAAERRLRAAGADGDLLLAIAKAKK